MDIMYVGLPTDTMYAINSHVLFYVTMTINTCHKSQAGGKETHCYWFPSIFIYCTQLDRKPTRPLEFTTSMC